MRLEKAKLEEANRLKRLKMDEDKRRAKEEHDAAVARKRSEIAKRAEEVARKAREEKEREAKLAEEERKMKKELRMGGGFDLKKYNAMKAAKAEAKNWTI